MKSQKSRDQVKKLEEYVDAKSIREILHFAKSCSGILENEETFDRKGKRRLVHVHLQKYYQKLQ